MCIFLPFSDFYEEEKFFIRLRKHFFSPQNPDFSPHEAGRLGAKRDKNVLKTPIFLLIDGEWDTKNECHFVGRTCRRLTHGSTSCGRNLPGSYRLQVCGSERDAMCFASGAWESRRFRRAGFGAEIRESRVRLCGTKRWWHESLFNVLLEYNTCLWKVVLKLK